MATTITGLDNNQSFITRAGNVTSTSNITSVNLGDNQQIRNGSGLTTINNDDVKSRDSDAPLGNNNKRYRPINSDLVYSWERNYEPSGIRIDGIKINGINQQTATYNTDEAANDGWLDGGEFYWRRSNTITSDEYNTPT